MIIFEQVTECDFNGTKYNKPVDGVAMLAQGATGRWCQVLHGGPEYKQQLINSGETILTHEQAVDAVTKSGNGTVDF